MQHLALLSVTCHRGNNAIIILTYQYELAGLVESDIPTT